MKFLKSMFGRRRALPLARPSHEDVDLESLGLSPARARTNYDGVKAIAKIGVNATIGKLEPKTEAKIAPSVNIDRPPAAIKISDEEQTRLLTGVGGAPNAGKDALLQELNEVGFNLKQMLSIVKQMQDVVGNNYDILTEAERDEAVNFVRSLRAVVIKEDQPTKRVA